MGSAKDIAILSDILSATAADGGAAGDGDLSLLEVLQAYEQVLPEHGLSVHEDSYYYRVLLQWSLNASTRSGWRQCLQAACCSTSTTCARSPRSQMPSPCCRATATCAAPPPVPPAVPPTPLLPPSVYSFDQHSAAPSRRNKDHHRVQPAPTPQPPWRSPGHPSSVRSPPLSPPAVVRVGGGYAYEGQPSPPRRAALEARATRATEETVAEAAEVIAALNSGQDMVEHVWRRQHAAGPTDDSAAHHRHEGNMWHRRLASIAFPSTEDEPDEVGSSLGGAWPAEAWPADDATAASDERVWPCRRLPAESPGGARAIGRAAAYGEAYCAAIAEPIIERFGGDGADRIPLTVAAVMLARRALLRRIMLRWHSAAGLRAAARQLRRRTHASHVTGMWVRWRDAGGGGARRATEAAVPFNADAAEAAPPGVAADARSAASSAGGNTRPLSAACGCTAAGPPPRGSAAVAAAVATATMPPPPSSSPCSSAACGGAGAPRERHVGLRARCRALRSVAALAPDAQTASAQPPPPPTTTTTERAACGGSRGCDACDDTSASASSVPAASTPRRAPTMQTAPVAAVASAPASPCRADSSSANTSLRIPPPPAPPAPPEQQQPPVPPSPQQLPTPLLSPLHQALSQQQSQQQQRVLSVMVTARRRTFFGALARHAARRHAHRATQLAAVKAVARVAVSGGFRLWDEAAMCAVAVGRAEGAAAMAVRRRRLASTVARWVRGVLLRHDVFALRSRGRAARFALAAGGALARWSAAATLTRRAAAVMMRWGHAVTREGLVATMERWGGEAARRAVLARVSAKVARSARRRRLRRGSALWRLRAERRGAATERHAAALVRWARGAVAAWRGRAQRSRTLRVAARAAATAAAVRRLEAVVPRWRAVAKALSRRQDAAAAAGRHRRSIRAWRARAELVSRSATMWRQAARVARRRALGACVAVWRAEATRSGDASAHTARLRAARAVRALHGWRRGAEVLGLLSGVAATAAAAVCARQLEVALGSWRRLAQLSRLLARGRARSLARLGASHLRAWRQLVVKLGGLRLVQARLVRGSACEVLVAWRQVTVRRAACRARAAELSARHATARRAGVFGAWRRHLGVSRAAAVLQLEWFESVVVCCWRAWRGAARASRRDERREAKLEEAMVGVLSSHPALHAAAYRAVAHWLLLRAARAFLGWRVAAWACRWRRSVTAQVGALRARGLADRTFRGWRDATWHARCVRAARQRIEEEGPTALQLVAAGREPPRLVAAHWPSPPVEQAAFA